MERAKTILIKDKPVTYKSSLLFWHLGFNGIERAIFTEDANYVLCNFPYSLLVFENADDKNDYQVRIAGKNLISGKEIFEYFVLKKTNNIEICSPFIVKTIEQSEMFISTFMLPIELD